MSFSLQFTATSPRSAREQLQKASAPNGVKALVELALAGMWPRPAPSASPSRTNTESASTASSQPCFIGVRVDCWGHMAYSERDRSWLERFNVEPLYE